MHPKSCHPPSAAVNVTRQSRFTRKLGSLNFEVKVFIGEVVHDHTWFKDLVQGGIVLSNGYGLFTKWGTGSARCYD
ncbi:hypothetical protein AAHA92_00213 [Salvia divinorum]|uniref:Uncharacterized protein n=1 Tax=Salvia divinorum TaxID=28513 RepID=A0ABD1IIT2_SALDI